MYQVKDIAKLVLTIANTRETPINNLKLQLILYHLFVWYYKDTEKLLFEDEFEIITFGFQIPDVHFTYCEYGGHPILSTYHDVDVKRFSGSLLKKITCLVDTSVNELSDTAKNTPCWKKYANKSGESKKIREITVKMIDMICLNCI